MFILRVVLHVAIFAAGTLLWLVAGVIAIGSVVWIVRHHCGRPDQRPRRDA